MPFAKVNGVNLYYEVLGDGEPIVFIHGVAISSKVWCFQMEQISRRYKMIVYDLRGSGKSEKTPEVQHTAELLCDDLHGLLDHLGIQRAHVVGLSLGAAVAMKFAMKYPDRIRCLILSGAFSDLAGILKFLGKYMPGIIGKVLMTKWGGELATKLMLPSAPARELLYYHSNIISIDKDEVKKYEQILNSYTITTALERIQSPTLILYGQHERVMHPYGRLIHKNIKNSRMEIVPGVGHGWNGEKPELFSHKVIEFIEQNHD